MGIYSVSDYISGRVWGIAPDYGAWQMEELLDTSLFVTGSGEDEAGNIYFTSCECGYGQTAPNPRGALWMLVATDAVPDGATLAPSGPNPAGEEIVEEAIEAATPAA